MESTERIQRTSDLGEDPPRGSDFSILFFQELSVSGEEPGPDLPINTLLTNLYREFDKNNVSYFVEGMGSNTKLPRFVPESGSYYFANLDAKAEEEARKEKEAQLARDREEQDKIIKKQIEQQKSAEAKAREEKESQKTAKAEKEESNAVDSSDEPDLGEALALIEQMKAEAVEREKQLKEANEQAEKKRKNTTSFGF